MPDHLHWLFQLRGQNTLEQVVGTVKSVSAHGLDRYLCRRGRVWQAGYYDHALRKEEELIGVARYIVENPLRAGLVKNLGDYPLWDSIWIEK
jgi:REP element-mobilizing transposase RayT